MGLLGHWSRTYQLAQAFAIFGFIISRGNGCELGVDMFLTEPSNYET